MTAGDVITVPCECGDAPGSGKVDLYIVNHFESVRGFVQAGRAKGTRVATSNWSVEQALCREGYQPIQTEDLLTTDLAAEADAFLYAIIRGWYIHEGQDFTAVDGISLGRVHEYEHLHRQTHSTEAYTAVEGFSPFVKALVQFEVLLRLVKPAVIHHDMGTCAALDALRIVTTQQGIALKSDEATCRQRLAGQSVGSSPQGIRRWMATLAHQGRQIARSVGIRGYCWVRTLQSLGRRPSIMMVPYPCLKDVPQRLKGRGYQVNNPCLWVDSSGPEQGDVRKIHHDLVQRWAKVQMDSAYWKRYVFRGIDCSPYFRQILCNTVEKDFRRTLTQWCRLQSIYQKLNVGAVAVPFDEPNFARLCVLVACARKIPTFVAQHGLFAYVRHGHSELRTADHACVISAYDASELKQLMPATQINVIGCLQLDQYAERRHSAVVPNPDKAVPLRILVLTFACSTFSVQSKSTDPELFLLAIARALAPHMHRIRVAFKLHPSEKSSRYESVLATIQPMFTWSLITGWKLPDVLTDYDLVIAPVSTGVAEALFLRKPTIFFRTTSEPVPRMFEDGSGLMTAHNSEELSCFVNDAAGDYAAFVQRYDFDKALSWVGPLDGRAAERFAQAIDRVIREKTGTCTDNATDR